MLAPPNCCIWVALRLKPRNLLFRYDHRADSDTGRVGFCRASLAESEHKRQRTF